MLCALACESSACRLTTTKPSIPHSKGVADVCLFDTLTDIQSLDDLSTPGAFWLNPCMHRETVRATRSIHKAGGGTIRRRVQEEERRAVASAAADDDPEDAAAAAILRDMGL